jgi:SAM-dependent methyltransferase
MESLVYHRDTCRLCESPDVELVLKMAPCPPVDAYISPDQLKDEQPRFPMDLYLCHACGHGQLLDVVSPKLLFGSYIYTTSSSPGLVEYFKDYVSKVYDQVKPPQNGLAVDIGSNDGTLLSFFKQRGLRVLGVDPAREIANAATAAGIETFPEFFNSKVAARLRAERGPANLITANNVFAHSDQLGDMAEGIKLLLAPDGVFVFEVSYLLDMVENMVFDFIYHEHLSHHSVKPLQTFLRKHGLHLFAVERTPSKGGTIRCFAQPMGGPRPELSSVVDLIKLEEKFGLYRSETYKVYSGRIDRAKQQLQALLKKVRAEGKTIAGYGASATGTVLTYHFDLGDSMSFIIDDNPVRQNRFSPGHHIPVVSSRALVEKKPDFVIILVWRFADMIIQKSQVYLKQGGHFIVPLPELKIV